MPLPLILSYVANDGAIRRHVSIDWDELPRDSCQPLVVDLPDFAAIEKSPKSAAEKAQKRDIFCRAVLDSIIRRISIPLLLAFIAAASNPLGKCADISITAGGRKYRFGGFMPSGKPLLYDIREVERILDRRDWISSVLAAQMVELLEDLKSEASESPIEGSPSAEIVPIPGVLEEWLPVQSAVDLPFTGSACSFDKSSSDDKSENIPGQVDSSISPGLEPPDIPWRWSFGAVPFQVDSNSIPGFQDSSSSESGDIKGLQLRLNLEMEMKSPGEMGAAGEGQIGSTLSENSPTGLFSQRATSSPLSSASPLLCKPIYPNIYRFVEKHGFIVPVQIRREKTPLIFTSLEQIWEYNRLRNSEFDLQSTEDSPLVVLSRGRKQQKQRWQSRNRRGRRAFIQQQLQQMEASVSPESVKSTQSSEILSSTSSKESSGEDSEGSDGSDKGGNE